MYVGLLIKRNLLEKYLKRAKYSWHFRCAIAGLVYGMYNLLSWFYVVLI